MKSSPIALLLAAVIIAGCGKNSNPMAPQAPASSDPSPSSPGGNPNPNPNPSPSPSKPALVGSWKGHFDCSDGSAADAVMKFAASGNPIFRYQTSSALREDELTHVGQVIQFVPPGGGVKTFVVEDLSVSADRVEFLLRVSFEKTSNGILDQFRSVQRTIAQLQPEGTMHVDFAVQSQNIASDIDLFVPGDPSVATCEATFSRQ